MQRSISVQPPWSEQVAFLIQLPGISLRTAMTILGAIGAVISFGCWYGAFALGMYVFRILLG